MHVNKQYFLSPYTAKVGFSGIGKSYMKQQMGVRHVTYVFAREVSCGIRTQDAHWHICLLLEIDSYSQHADES